MPIPRLSPAASILSLLVLLATPIMAAQPGPGPTPGIAGGDSRYLRMTDNFFIIFDPSTAMDVPYGNTGLTRIEAAKQILRESNAALPELPWQAGLYPHWKGELWLHGSPFAFNPYYRLQTYRKEAFTAAIEQLPTTPQSPPMLQTGLMKLEHLLGLPGRTELILFSDGNHLTEPGLEPKPLEEARRLASRFDICFSIVSSATDAKAKKLLEDIAAVNSCSQVIDFDTAFAKPEHLLGKLYLDTKAEGFDTILFDFDKSAVRPEYTDQLERVSRFLKDHPESYAVFSGFCDSTGTEAYNIGLSRRRAESVGGMLHRKFGIDKSRILLYWYGYANPVASNETETGRQQNRRVAIILRDGK